MKCFIQIFLGVVWQTAAEFDASDDQVVKGIDGRSTFSYIDDYTLAQLNQSQAARVSLAFPVNFNLYFAKRWPAFLLDILPTGAGRRIWSERLRKDGEEISDFALLTRGAGNPPGNIRIAEAVIPPPTKPHRGFTIEQIVEKNADFIEFAESQGAVVSGATDVAGEAPKFLVTQDKNRRWHPDGALTDDNISASWIVKFARGKSADDALVLRTEPLYYTIARDFGIRTGADLKYTDGALFIRRFDRAENNGVLVRYGLETLCSVAGIAAYGVRGDNALFCQAIARYASDAAVELREYLLREILNVALRNTDNHGRNTSLIKYPDGRVELSPLYDFAPMFLDPEGIPRASRWTGALEPSIGRPDWGKIAESLGPHLNAGETRRFLASHAEALLRLPEKMRTLGVADRVVDGVALRSAEIAADLKNCAPGVP